MPCNSSIAFFSLNNLLSFIICIAYGCKKVFLILSSFIKPNESYFLDHISFSRRFDFEIELNFDNFW